MSEPVGPGEREVTPAERDVITRQLGRPPRALVGVAHRCPCGQPDVVRTAPRLEDGTPFPTLYYLTCPRARAAASRLESAGLMRQWQEELGADLGLAAAYHAAHEAFLATRDAAGDPLPGRASAGGMPDRVKCLHALAAHALAAGAGVNPIGDRAVAGMGQWWAAGPCAGLVTRVAAIDCGTNSLRLLVADVPAQGAHTDLLRRMEIVRLGAGVDATGRFTPQAIERTRIVLAEYAAAARELGATALRMVATSASRDAANRADFEDMVVATLGRPPDVVPGLEEAELSYLGATASLAAAAAAQDAAPPSPPYLVVDIGGGSTEFVLGNHTGVHASCSVDVGCVRLTERHLHSDPPTADEIGGAEADIRRALAQVAAAVPVGDAATLVGLAGSVTTVAALALGLPAYDADAIHGSRIPVGTVRSVTAGLLTANRARRAALAVMHPGRVDVIGAGALVLRVLMDAFALDEVVVSEHDILDGIALQLARG